MGESGVSGGNKNVNVLAAAAHDLKTPLAIIAGLASELAERGENPERLAETGGQISHATEQLISMIDSVVLAYRVDQTELELDLAPVDMRSVINDVAYEMGPLAEKLDHRLDVRISRRLPTVMAHRESVEKVLTNLIDTVLRVSQPEQKIVLTARQHGDDVTLTVTDKSHGMKPSELKKAVHTPGAQLQPSPALGSSSGIRLYVINQLIRAMHGDFIAQTKGRNSVFLLRLPQVTQLRLFE